MKKKKKKIRTMEVRLRNYRPRDPTLRDRMEVLGPESAGVAGVVDALRAMASREVDVWGRRDAAWDLRRDAAGELEALERRTRAAVATLARG
jgi:hypothetical protein